MSSDKGEGEETGSTPVVRFELRHAMRNILIAWLFGASWLFATSGAPLTRFAKLLGLPPFGFGVLAALPFAGALVEVPASLFIARFGHRKTLIIAAGMSYRALWVGIALIPWVLPTPWWWPALLVIRALSSLGGHVMRPAVLSWFADVIPGRIRGRFFSRWTQGGRLVGLVVTLIVGPLLDWAQEIGQTALLRTISIVFAVAAVMGMIDFLWLIPLPDVAHKPEPRIRLRQLFGHPLRDKNFLHYLGYTVTLTLAMGYIGQFVFLYLFDVVGVSHARANLMLMAVPLVISILVVRPWGRLIDRLGCKPTMVIAGVLIIHGAAAWILVTPQHQWPGFMVVVVAMAAWPGVELANFNMLLAMSESKEGKRQGSAYVAVNSVAVAVAGTLSGLFGGAMARALGDWRGSLLGLTITYHGVLFLISGGLRFLALLWLVGLEEPRAYPTRAAVRYVFSNVYSNLQQALFAPARVLVKLSRLAVVVSQRTLRRRR